MASKLTLLSNNKCFGGFQQVFSHFSEELKCEMRFGIFNPPQCENAKVPVIWFLSGLTASEQNFVLKAGAQQYASKHGVVLISPDTSPRGCNLPGEDEKWNVGTGAGLYLNATKEPWKKHYRMYSYIIEELPQLIVDEKFPVMMEKQSIMGHSMGGHGAMICAFRNPGLFKSISLFAPVCDSSRCGAFQEALTAYLGNPVDGDWDKWNATSLVKTYDGPPLDILIDQGTDDEFLEQLYPNEFVEACMEVNMPVTFRMRQGYDHGYFFISTYIENHFEHHMQYLLD